jgi:uncharacterized protein
MSTMILAFVFMLAMVSIMAVGVIMGRSPITGSCGGMKALGMDVECEICGGNPALCDTADNSQAKTESNIDPDLTTRVGR